jgi:hypothetical protein
MGKTTKYTRELLAPVVKTSPSIAGVLRVLGLRASGGNYGHIQRLIVRYGLDVSHMKGAQQRGLLPWSARKSPSYRRPDEILVVGPELTRPCRGALLRRKLIEIGRELKCSECGLQPFWNGRPLRLEVDHINGKAWDNRPENLRFVCPNCHSQTNTDGGVGPAGRKTRRRALPSLCECGNTKQRASRTCSQCNPPRKERAQWPVDSELAVKVWQVPPSVIARQLGVSGNAVAHRCRRRGIALPARGYWTKLRAGKV